ncbi:DNA polymerase epsilon catalytic subunit A [Hondaea fermentalgiana]|uniref:DNA-directed DNA polymerase n=1 Tax=Hondaea fermentalgiana TaxID=2315210 RepID=A0A2R5GVQ4_9STRA|nr:DNA polymerase epsilon catalytic subunit A [Hondaea fermentalgiana]|eukprot:GBG32491.1 DNA polymerase epsilon catalytic subunit A [Hondaea fermentalgiana]
MGWSGRRQGGQGFKKRGARGVAPPPQRQRPRTKASQDFRDALREQSERVDEMYGFDDFTEGPARVGWLLNMLPCTVNFVDPTLEKPVELSALELYFLQQDGNTFKAKILHRPYFYVLVKEEFLKETKAMLERRFASDVSEVAMVDREDLDMADHLAGKHRVLLQLFFRNVNDLMNVRLEVQEAVRVNKSRSKAADAYNFTGHDATGSTELPDDLMEAIVDLREYDVQYQTRVSIDLDVNVGSWYEVSTRFSDGTGAEGLGVDLKKLDLLEKAEPRILAFDIECTKQPHKFPDAAFDQVFMISYMFDGQGYLIINREVVTEDIEDFEYTPKPEYPGPFEVFNEADEESTLRKFFEHCRELRPNVWVTYNGDFFDWPFIEKRAATYDMDLRTEVGVGPNKEGTEYRGRCSVHMDCLYWVKRDSYLPAGSRGLKAVTKAKLGYDPVEVDPEDMVRFARERPHHMASYSVSDAVATYYLFDKYINLFIFSLCTIIPLPPDDVLRKGSGTLCEMLLMVEARRGNILCPNKQVDPAQKFTDKGQLLEQDTYIGGHVECLETGVYRDDLPEKFRLDPLAFDELIANIDRDLTFAIEIEAGIPRREVVNYAAVRSEIVEALEMLRDTPVRLETPTIYHLDVAAMYPNIILTNRLQPSAIVDETDCASCSFNTGPDAACKRPMDWVWRGEFYPAKRSEYQAIKTQLEYEQVDGVPYHELPRGDRNRMLRQRVKTYSQTVYRRVKDTEITKKSATICQRENSFYVDTIKAFRDRRYEYKRLTKKWAKEKSTVEKRLETGSASADPLALDEARNKVLLYDSLQLAHKCILNSFYGYVMRKGARWHSMEMAGIVTHTGGNIIKQARKLVERIGRPLELDTDGIWCILPASFPENFALKTGAGRKIPISYPCVMLNADVHAHFTNHQYQSLVDPKHLQYDTRSECSIYFEVDGPYRCMVLPASQEEGKLLKKRYAVFNHDGTLAELKGFELKRRGELKIIKIFQSQVFEKFLLGGSLPECYAAVAEIANYWLDVLFTRGKDLSDEELIELISENRSMSRKVEEYGDRKSVAMTTARRLSEIFGAEMIRDAGLNCKLLIARKPVGEMTTARAIPAVIFSLGEDAKRQALRRWLRDNSITDFDVRSIVDWDYYIDRLGKAVQKIITIPAALQNVANPVPRIEHPAWLLRDVREKNGRFKQSKLSALFQASAKSSTSKTSAPAVADIEDMLGGGRDGSSSSGAKPKGKSARSGENSMDLDEDAKGDDDDENENENEDEANAEIGDPQDFDGWLAARKTMWRRRQELYKAQQKEQQALTSSGAGGPAPKFSLRNGLQGFVQRREALSDFGYLQVLEVRPVDSAGTFRVFVLPENNDEVRSMYMKVNRKFFLNSREPCDPKEAPPWLALRDAARWKLPHAHAVEHLYQLEAPEKYMRKHAKTVADILEQPNVAGVYELQTSPESRILSELGCMISVNQRNLSGDGTASRPFAMAEVRKVARAGAPYLLGSGATLQRFFLFVGGRPQRRAVVIFQVSQTSNELAKIAWSAMRGDKAADQVDTLLSLAPQEVRIHAWIEGHERSGTERPSLRKAMRSFLDDCSKESRTAHAENLRSSVAHAEVTTVATEGALWHKVNEHLVKMARELSGAVTAVVHSALSPRELLAKSMQLGHFPCIWMTAREDTRALPSLQWQKYLFDEAVRQYFAHSLWLFERMRCAHYAQVPVAHLGDDYAVAMMDVMFMRNLSRNSHVSWASPACTPDLGGMESDSADSALLAVEELPVIASPGTYRSYCAVFSLKHLAVNTMLHADEVHDIECAEGSLALEQHSMGALAPDGGTQRLDAEGAVVHAKVHAATGVLGSAAECLGAFNILRGLVRRMFREALQTNEDYCWALLTNFYRWLCSPKSLMYDPALLRFVQQLMSKVFLQLVAELRRLGAKIVSANFQRIIICTGKRDAASASAYVEHVINTVQSKSLFEDIELELADTWKTLIFMDDANFGAVQDNPTYNEELEAYEKRQARRKQIESERQARRDGTLVDAPRETSNQKVSSSSERKASSSTTARRKRRLLRKNANDDPAEDASSEEEDQEDDDAEVSPVVRKTAKADKESENENEDGKEEKDRDKEARNDNDADDDDDDDVAAADGYVENEDSASDSDLDDEEFDGNLTRLKRRVMTDSRRPKRGRNKREDRIIEREDELNEAEDMDDFVVDDDGDSFYGAAASRDADEEALLEAARPPFKHTLILQWDVAQYLPEELQRYFELYVGAFLLKPVEFRESWLSAQKEKLRAEMHVEREETKDPSRDIAGKADGSNSDELDELALLRVNEAELEVEEKDFVTKLLKNEVVAELLRLIPRITMSGLGAESFPKLAGSHLVYKDPALEFVKTLCVVLSLEGQVHHQVQTAKKQLLRLLHVREFAPEAQFHNPSLTIHMRDVVCSHCNAAVDFDLCRDTALVQGQLAAGPDAGTQPWHCTECAETFDMASIEHRLIRRVEDLVLAFELQDFECIKCGQVRADVLSASCTCSGDWVLTISPKDQETALRPLHNVAKFYGFEWLLESVVSAITDVRAASASRGK